MFQILNVSLVAVVSSGFLLFSSAGAAQQNYCNGQTHVDSSGSYYPNAQKISDNWGTYYPNGAKVKDNWASYYPNGQKLQDNWGTYYPNKKLTRDNWGVYYPNGQKVRDNWGCYYSNGTKLEPCRDVVTARARINEVNVMTFDLNTTTGEISNFRFEERSKDAKYVMLYDVDILAGVVTTTDALCEDFRKAFSTLKKL